MAQQINNEKTEIKKYLESVKSSQTTKITDFTYGDENDIYLGAMRKYEKKNDQFTSIANLNQNVFTISANTELCKKIEDVDLMKKKISLNIGVCKLSFLRDIIYCITSNIKQPPTNSYGYIYQATSIKDLEIKSDISFQTKNIKKFLTSFFSNQRRNQQNAIVSIITVEHFTINVDYENRLGPFNIIKDGVSLSDIKSSISKDDIPLFISSCKAGKQIILSIQTSINYEDLKKRLNLNGAFIADIKSFILELFSFNDVNINTLMIGGDCPCKMDDNKKWAIQVLSELYNTRNGYGTIFSYRLSNLCDNSTFGYPKKNNTLSILYVIPDSRFKRCIDFSFLEKYRTESFSINHICIKESEFKTLLFENNQYLSTFNILMLGGVDGKDSYSIFDEDLVTIIDNWRKTKGFLLFLHDFITGKQKDLFENIVNDLGFLSVNKKISTFKKIKIKNNAPNTLRRDPNTVLNSFQIAETHESVKYQSKYVLIEDYNSKDHYYAENLLSRVADCSIGHNAKITENEERIFVNILKNIAMWLFDSSYSDQQSIEDPSNDPQPENSSNSDQHPINSSNNQDQREEVQINQLENNEFHNDDPFGIGIYANIDVFSDLET